MGDSSDSVKTESTNSDVKIEITDAFDRLRINEDPMDNASTISLQGSVGEEIPEEGECSPNSGIDMEPPEPIPVILESPGDKPASEEVDKGTEHKIEGMGDAKVGEPTVLIATSQVAPVLVQDEKVGTASASATVPQATPPPSTVTVLPEEQIHQVKYISWGSTRYPVVTQNSNGPCPLLAIVNVLLLRGQIHLADNAEMVTGQQLIEHIGDCILRLAPLNLNVRVQADYEHNVSDAMQVINKLMTGLDVNVRFTGIGDFEYTKECIVFDLLGIPLYHGWLIDANDTQTMSAVGSKSYNQLVEAIISNRSSDDAEKFAQATACESFLESSASQLTPHGLTQLTSLIKDNELAVFFRNNHFSTIMKHEGQLLLLVTDAGFLKETNVVWETLSNVQNDSSFLDSSFQKIAVKEESGSACTVVPMPPGDTQGQIDHDFLVALSLEQDDTGEASKTSSDKATPAVTNANPPDHDLDAQLALQLQQEEDGLVGGVAEGGSPVASGGGGAAEHSHGHRHKEKKDKCIIL